MGAEFKKLNRAEQAAVAAYVRAEYDRLVFQEPNSYVSRNAQADPEVWLERLRELIASDRKRVQAIVEQARSQTKIETGGFTLIEMAIVLVIIGLIIGAILVGQSLIHSAQIQRIMKEQTQFAEAINTFYGKYNCIPGDCPNATNFFGSAGGTSAATDYNCYFPASTNMGSTGTCNGNGDGKIGTNGGWSFTTGANATEKGFLWQHLALAGLIAGQYATFGQGVSYGHEPGYNSPASTALPNGEWATMRIDDSNTASTLSMPNGSTGVGVAPNLVGQHALMLGSYLYNSGGGFAYGPQGIISPKDALAFDQKYDDGLPFSGFITWETNSTGGQLCSNPANLSATNFNVAENLNYTPCLPLFMLQLP